MNRFLPILFIFLTVISCGRKTGSTSPTVTSETKEQKKDTVIPVKKDQRKIDSISLNKWNETNDRLYSNFKKRIEPGDIKMVYETLIDEKIITREEKVHNSSYPFFTHFSPTVMLDEITIGKKPPSERPLEEQVITLENNRFIMTQERLYETGGFKWKTITDHVDTTDNYPRLEISPPVFSLDKKIFIVCVDRVKSKFCLSPGISYVFIKKKGETQYFILEKISNCN